MKLFKRIYPLAYEERKPISHPSVRPFRLAFLKAASINFLILQVLFLGLYSYIFGSLFQQNEKVHNLNVVFVDYDHGSVGDSIRTAYEQLKGPGFFTLKEKSPTQFATEQELRTQVCHMDYWAALFVNAGSSARLAAAIAGNLTSFDNTNLVEYIWDEVPYSATTDDVIVFNMVTLSAAAQVAYLTNTTTEPLKSLDSSSSVAIGAAAQPWSLTANDIKETSQGSRLIYNTLVFILVMLQEFFYLGNINGLFLQTKLFIRVKARRAIFFRTLLSVLFTFIGSLVTVGAIWAFRNGWPVNGNQFVLSWMVVWLLAHVNFLVFDCLSIWLPPPYFPVAMFSWVVISITSILLPFSLSSAFYRVGYALPVHEAYVTLLDIWSGGCYPRLYISLPILFSWELAAWCLSSFGVYRRSHYAVLGERAQEAAFKQKVCDAIAAKKEAGKGEPVVATATNEEGALSTHEAPSAESPADGEPEAFYGGNEEDFGDVERRASVATRNVNFGPAFPLALTSSEFGEVDISARRNTVV
jgi:hypothetical protein